MAIGEHKNKSPYHGIFVICFFLIVVPVALYFLFRAIFSVTQTDFPAELNEATARTVAFGVGFLFHLACIIAGALKDSFRLAVMRVADFFENWKVSFKLACSCYVDDIKENGIAFWIMFAIMIANFCVFVSGLKLVLAYFL